MTSADIENEVARRIDCDDVVSKMFTWGNCMINSNELHVKSASYSSCQCNYCAAIKRYVRAKILFQRIHRDCEPYLEEYAERLLSQLTKRKEVWAHLKHMTEIKNNTVKPQFSLAELLPN